MNREEFKEMCRLCLGDKAATPGSKEYNQTMQLLKELDKSRDGEITLQEFRGAETKGSSLLFIGLMELQTTLQKNVIGVRPRPAPRSDDAFAGRSVCYGAGLFVVALLATS